MIFSGRCIPILSRQQRGDCLRKENRHRNNDGGKPQHGCAQLAGAAIALLRPVGLIEAKGNEQDRRPEQVWSQCSEQRRATGKTCGSNEWQIYRIGADIGMRCLGCDRRIMLPRRQFEKAVKKWVSHASDQTEQG